MKLATWNVNSLAIRLPHLLAWLAETQPDVVVLQETKLVDEKFPHAELKEAGWHAEFFGQKTYNGVALVSKLPATDIVRNIPGHADEQARVIAGTVGGVRIVGGYFPNGQAPGSDKFAYKMGWLDALRNWLAAELAANPTLVLMGDFNIAPEDRDVADPENWVGQVLVSEPERAAFKAFCDLGLTDSFRMFEQPDKLYSWWDYRQMAFRRNKGLRIDHILLSAPLVARCTSCVIDKVPRKWEQPSDHTPVVATLD